MSVSNDGFPTRSPVATVTVADCMAVAPALSVTCTLAVHVPAAYVWVAVACDCGPMTVASPKSNRYDAIEPSGSEEPGRSSDLAPASAQQGGSTSSAALGGWSRGATVTVADCVAVAPALSVTCTLAVHVPPA